MKRNLYKEEQEYVFERILHKTLIKTLPDEPVEIEFKTSLAKCRYCKIDKMLVEFVRVGELDRSIEPRELHTIWVEFPSDNSDDGSNKIKLEATDQTNSGIQIVSYNISTIYNDAVSIVDRSKYDSRLLEHFNEILNFEVSVDVSTGKITVNTTNKVRTLKLKMRVLK